MIDLYTAQTPNGHKASVTLEELALPYTVVPVDLGAGQQTTPEYLAINPNGRIPAIVDRDNNDFAVFESGAIMIYLAEKSGKLLPTDAQGRSLVLQWLMFQMAGLGPMQGQAVNFLTRFPERIESVIDRYQQETIRLYRVLDQHLAKNEYLAGDFSIADIANWCWVRFHDSAEIDIRELSNLVRWKEVIQARPAAVKGIAVPSAYELEKGNIS